MPKEALAIYDILTEANKQSVLSYLAFLLQEQKREKDRMIDDSFAEIHSLLSSSNPWNNEQEMLEELANDRRENAGIAK